MIEVCERPVRSVDVRHYRPSRAATTRRRGTRDGRMAGSGIIGPHRQLVFGSAGSEVDTEGAVVVRGSGRHGDEIDSILACVEAPRVDFHARRVANSGYGHHWWGRHCPQPNDLLQVSGGSGTSNGSTAWYYDAGSGMVSLGAGDGKAIDPLGAFVVGADSRSTPTSSARQPNNSWIAQALPQPSISIGATAYGVSRLADQRAIVVGANTLPTKIGANLNATQPVVWLRGSDGTWSNPQVYPTPSGFPSADAMDVNPLGHVVGHLGGSQGIVWENPDTYTILDGRAGRINAAGTLIVGQSADNAPVYWWRDGVTHQWRLPATRLPSIAGAACPDGYALDVNDAGVIAGWSCGTGKNPTVWLLDLSGPSPVLVCTPTRLPASRTRPIWISRPP